MAPPTDLRAAFERDGYAIVRGAIPPQEISRISAAFDELIAIARTLPATADVGQARFVVEAEPFKLHRVVWCGGANRTLAELGGDPRFVDLAKIVLGPGPLVQLIQQAHFKLPGDGVDFAWHQDASNRRYGSELWTDVDGRGSFVQLALAVDPMGAKNGGLKVIPGSHRGGFVADPNTGALPADRFNPSDAIDPVLEPGDVLLFGPFLIHGSAANFSDGPRRLLLQGYALPGANHRIYPGCGLGVVRP